MSITLKTHTKHQNLRAVHLAMSVNRSAKQVFKSGAMGMQKSIVRRFSEYNTELVELYSLRKILVMADRLLLAVETDGTVSVEDEKRLRREIEKVKKC